MFQQYSIEVDTASDGLEAIKMVKQLLADEEKTYDLILMDFKIQTCSGPEVTIQIHKFLRENAINLHRPFICCLTSYGDKKYKQEALKSGMDDFYVKPIFKKGIQSLLSKLK